MEHLISALGKVISGNEEATRESGLEDMKLETPAMPSLSWLNIQLEHARCAEIIAAAKHLGLPILEETAKVTVNYLVVMAKSKYNKNLEAITLEPDKYAQTMKAIVEDIQRTIVPMAKRCVPTMLEESCESTEEVDVLPGKSLQKEAGAVDTREDCVVHIDDDDIVGYGHSENVEDIDKQKGHAESKTVKPTKAKETVEQPRQKVSTCKTQNLEKDDGRQDSNEDSVDDDIDDFEDGDVEVIEKQKRHAQRKTEKRKKNQREENWQTTLPKCQHR